jgi:hypothetical protein
MCISTDCGVFPQTHHLQIPVKSRFSSCRLFIDGICLAQYTAAWFGAGGD